MGDIVEVGSTKQYPFTDKSFEKGFGVYTTTKRSYHDMATGHLTWQLRLYRVYTPKERSQRFAAQVNGSTKPQLLTSARLASFEADEVPGNYRLRPHGHTEDVDVSGAHTCAERNTI